MSIPTVASGVFRRTDLAAYIQEVNNNLGFTIGRVAPPLTVPTQTGTLMVLKANGGMESVDTKRADGAPYKEMALDLTTSTYSTDEYGLTFKVGAAKAKAYRNQIDMDNAGAKFSSATVIRDIESDGYTAIYAAVSGNAAAAAWTSYSTATPAADVAVEADVIFKNHGITKDQLTLEIPAYLAARLAFIADYRTAMKLLTTPLLGSVSEAQAAQYFGVKEVVFAGAGYNTANEGQTASISYIAPTDKVLLYKRADGDIATDPGFAKSVIWEEDMQIEGDSGAMTNLGGLPILIEQWYEHKVREMNYRSRLHYGLFIMNSTMARKVTGC